MIHCTLQLAALIITQNNRKEILKVGEIVTKRGAIAPCGSFVGTL